MCVGGWVDGCVGEWMDGWVGGLEGRWVTLQAGGCFIVVK